MKTSKSLAVLVRPQTLEAVIGQIEAVAMIKGWVARSKVPSVILFSGPPGTGKTTLARIVSRLINKVGPNDKDYDYEEQNFSADGKVDDARELIQTAKYLPRKDLRVIALDEAQGATPQAIQAMLKIFEEPPKHTCWIVCTSEPQKLSTAFQSRCQKVTLQPYAIETIIKLLVSINKEHRLIKGMEQSDRKELYSTIAANSNCIPRDSIEMLDSAANLWASGNYKDPANLVKAVLRNADVSSDLVAVKVLLCIYTKSANVAVKAIRDSQNYRQTLDQMLHINQGLLDKLCGGKPWYTLSQKLFFEQLGDTQIIPVDAVKMHVELANIKQRMYYGADETNIVLGGICNIIHPFMLKNGK